jgi:hypothetical protein
MYALVVLKLAHEQLNPPFLSYFYSIIVFSFFINLFIINFIIIDFMKHFVSHTFSNFIEEAQ